MSEMLQIPERRVFNFPPLPCGMFGFKGDFFIDRVSIREYDDGTLRVAFRDPKQGDLVGFYPAGIVYIAHERPA